MVMDLETAQVRVWKNVENYCSAFQKFCKITPLHNHEKGKHVNFPFDLRVFFSTYEFEFTSH